MTTKKKSFDISDLSVSGDAAKVTIFHPVNDVPLVDDNDNEIFVEVYGENSEQYKSVLRNQKDRALTKAQRMGKVTITAALQEKNATELLAQCIKSWNITVRGETPGTDTASVEAVFNEFPWIKTQVEAGIFNQKNFMKG